MYGDGRVDSPELTLIITPPRPCSRKTWASARAQRAVSTRFWSRMSRQYSPSRVVDGPVPRPAIMPMLLTAMSRPPNAAEASSTMRSTSSSCRQSATMAWARPPSPTMASTTRWACCARTSATETEDPARASHRAISDPMPAPAPVTSALAPDRSMVTLIWSSRCSASGVAHVNDDLGTGHVPRLIAGQEGDLSGDVLWLHEHVGQRVHEDGTDRLRLGVDELLQVGVGHHGRGYAGGIDGVDPDVVLAQLGGKDAAQPNHPMLGCAVVRLEGEAFSTCRRAGQDDRPPRSLFDHGGYGRLRRLPHAFQVDAAQLVPLF